MRKAYGSGVATIASNGDLLDCWYLDVSLSSITNKSDRSENLKADPVRGVTKREVDLEIDMDEAP